MTDVQIFENMPIAEYHARPEISSTMIKQAAKSLAHLKHMLDHGFRRTPAMDFGTAAHLYMLEPDSFLRDVAIIPEDLDRRSKAGKEKYKEIVGDKIIVIDEEDLIHLNGMKAALEKDDDMKSLLRASKKEYTVIWDGCRCRFDMIDGGLIVDYKTTVSAEPEAFNKAIYNYRYDLQAAHYIAGGRALMKKLGHGNKDPQFLFLAQEKEPPYLYSLHRFDKDKSYCIQELTDGHTIYHEDKYVRAGTERLELINRIQQARETGVWAGYPSHIHNLPAPKYFQNRGLDNE